MIYIWYISVGVKQWVFVLWTWQEWALTVVLLSKPQISRPDYPYPTHCDTPPYHSIIKLNRAVPRHASLRIVDPVGRFECLGIDISEGDKLSRVGACIFVSYRGYTTLPCTPFLPVRYLGITYFFLVTTSKEGGIYVIFCPGFTLISVTIYSLIWFFYLYLRSLRSGRRHLHAR